MKAIDLSALDIPKEDAELAPWLERRVVGCHLIDFIAVRSALCETLENRPLADVLGGELDAVLESGLGVLSPEQLRKLLAAPLSLLELQDRVFDDGSPYWDGVERTAEHLASAERVRAAVTARLLAERQSIAVARPKRSTKVPALFALAASVLIGLGVWALRPAPPSGWGFDRPGVLAQQIPAPEYLRMLAGAAGEWSNKPTKTAGELQNRLGQFRDGCDSLLLADHPQLTQQDRAWLLARCTAWRDQIERLLFAAESGEPIDEVRSDADALADTIRDELLRKAKEVG